MSEEAPSPIRRRSPRIGESARILQQARIAGPMPWVIAIMIALTVMAASAGLALGNLAANARAEIAGGITVQIVEGAPASRDRQAERAVSYFANREDVADVRRVPDEELAELLEPWLGEIGRAEQDTVPIPAMVDVRLSGPVTAERLRALRAELLEVAPSARMDAQASWLGPVFDAVRSLQWLAIGLVMLLAVTSAAAVWLAARSALGTNRDTIEVIHHLGGTDRQIARIFQRSIGKDAALGGLAGLLLGLAAIFVLGRQFSQLGSGLVAGGGLGVVDWIAIVAIPVIGIALAVITARFTVIAALRRML
ncbi:cell division protein FtsX [Aurantiacibacter aquimixticola]|uniref:FtsX-like permease family protein n=1 Tax=Aurantiacibacter aquimixticola TaxID=1958945 RepID=A0A419RVG2_9SPHN|nr:FtsX-like permease family protein [Aurantiacibacter aquimixticola]RJY09773.1 FtsX-like permease family protein [Aurantiacibacter aquimixticola]